MQILILNQAFYPDVVATAQHASDLAIELAARGHAVRVVASRRAYDEPGVRYCRSETWNDVQIERVNCLGLRKKTKWCRAANVASFMLRCAMKLLLQPRQDVVVAMTSPPLVSSLAALLVKLRGGRLVCWIMDLNPDEAIAAGWIQEKSPMAMVLHALLTCSLKAASRVIVLDRFMKERIESKGVATEKISVIPPWSHDNYLRYDPKGRNEFRSRHGVSEKFVVMYSGNHSPCHPLDTLLEATLHFAHESTVVFCFIGGGSEFNRVRKFSEEHKLTNILCLPYQPLDRLSDSLSAADLHVVVLGNAFVGIVHPCKIYNILRLGIPFLYIGPENSHIMDIPMAGECWRFTSTHGNIEAVVDQIQLAMRRSAVGCTTELAVAAKFAQRTLMPLIVKTIEKCQAMSVEEEPVAPECGFS